MSEPALFDLGEEALRADIRAAQGRQVEAS